MQEETLSFQTLGLSDELMQATNEMGFEKPSPIQAQAIPHLLQGLDVIGQAQTGTGKTAAFGLPALELVDVTEKHTQVLILCPTRELAVQVTDELRRLAKYKKGVKIETIYGGDSIERQIKSLRGGVHIVVGTPGRTMDMMERRALKLEKVSYMVLDEADEMLDMGFREDIESILEEMPEERQTVLFSATMSKPIMAITQKFQNDPVLVKVTRKEVTNENIEQVCFEVKQRAKAEVTCRLIDSYDLKQVIIFCNTKRKVDEITEELMVRGYQAEGLHGDLRQAQRNNVMAKFRAGTTTILVATDVAARGIDVSGVDAVINFDLPLDEEYYVHRIGRTGRAGRTGKALTLVAKDEKFRLRQIEGYTKVRIEKGVIPTFEDIVGVRKARFIEQVEKAATEGDLDIYSDMLTMLHHTTGLSTETIVAALVKINMGVQKSEFADTDLAWDEDRKFKDRNGARDDRGGRFEKRGEGSGRFGDRDRGGRGTDRDSRGGGDRQKRNDPGMIRLFVSVGRKDRVQPRDIVGAIAGEAGIPGRVIGSIDIFDAYSFVDVPERDARRVVEAMSGNTIKGKPVNIEVAR
ncbi:DEAD/DEAH box helicase [Runella sp. SP2]|uniref:DEAD/DEAH box helicase n=1 Tax=Runella sp. SP2 TaxID=2268026 RepID=UPI000F083633|nr:DEAD/DEAH box helicase [Runella sp. SP2]AYQ35529.1 RNA helicase [Runella sp. SP2]